MGLELRPSWATDEHRDDPDEKLESLDIKRSKSSSAPTPFQTHSKPSTRARTYSQRHDSDLTKKLENQFMKDERHSVPHEIYSECQHSFDDRDRPHSVPVNNVRGQMNEKCKDSDSSFRFVENLVSGH
jgi:hypothetical protein